MTPLRTAFIFSLLTCVSACQETSTTPNINACSAEFVILGAGQDAGAPQIGNPNDPAWQNPALRQTATAAALVDHRTQERYLFEAGPDISAQMILLDELVGNDQEGLGLSGIFITHAHIGHYAGLMFIGREGANVQNLPVFAMPRLTTYLSENGPWEQLVNLNNINLTPLADKKPTTLTQDITVTPHRVPHRDEYSETVGFIIEGLDKNVLFLPDLDSWDEWETDFDTRIVDILNQVDYAFIDATFYADNELPGRDMSKIPHPRVLTTMDRFAKLLNEMRAKVYFIHYNHSNPIRYKDSKETQEVASRGFNIARAGDRFCLLQQVEN